jgi:hypothetical protein
LGGRRDQGGKGGEEADRIRKKRKKGRKERGRIKKRRKEVLKRAVITGLLKYSGLLQYSVTLSQGQ